MLIPWVWYPIVAFSKRTLCEPDCTAIESSPLNITLLVILMFVPVTSKPSVLKAKLADVEYASMIASLTVMLLPINWTFQAMGLRDLKCRREPFVVLKLNS